MRKIYDIDPNDNNMVFDRDEYNVSLETLASEAIELEDNFKILDNAITAHNKIKASIVVSNEALDKGDVNKTLLALDLNNLLDQCSAVGYDAHTVTVSNESDDVNETYKSLIVSKEGIASDIWEGIKKFFSAIWEGIKKFFKKVSSFFKLEESKAKSDIEKVKELSDFSDISLDKKETIKYINSIKTKAVLFLHLGYDPTDSKSIENYIELVEATLDTNLSDKKFIEDMSKQANVGNKLNPIHKDLSAITTSYHLYADKDAISDNYGNKTFMRHDLITFNANKLTVLSVEKIGVKNVAFHKTDLKIHELKDSDIKSIKISDISKSDLLAVAEAKRKLISKRGEVEKKLKEGTKLLDSLSDKTSEAEIKSIMAALSSLINTVISNYATGTQGIDVMFDKMFAKAETASKKKD